MIYIFFSEKHIYCFRQSILFFLNLLLREPNNHWIYIHDCVPNISGVNTYRFTNWNTEHKEGVRKKLAGGGGVRLGVSS